jgi:hypothetical protein
MEIEEQFVLFGGILLIVAMVIDWFIVPWLKKRKK